MTADDKEKNPDAMEPVRPGNDVDGMTGPLDGEGTDLGGTAITHDPLITEPRTTNPDDIDARDKNALQNNANKETKIPSELYKGSKKRSDDPEGDDRSGLIMGSGEELGELADDSNADHDASLGDEEAYRVDLRALDEVLRDHCATTAEFARGETERVVQKLENGPLHIICGRQFAHDIVLRAANEKFGDSTQCIHVTESEVLASSGQNALITALETSGHQNVVVIVQQNIDGHSALLASLLVGTQSLEDDDGAGVNSLLRDLDDRNCQVVVSVDFGRRRRINDSMFETLPDASLVLDSIEPLVDHWHLALGVPVPDDLADRIRQSSAGKDTREDALYGYLTPLEDDLRDLATQEDVADFIEIRLEEFVKHHGEKFKAEELEAILSEHPESRVLRETLLVIGILCEGLPYEECIALGERLLSSQSIVGTTLVSVTRSRRASATKNQKTVENREAFSQSAPDVWREEFDAHRRALRLLVDYDQRVPSLLLPSSWSRRWLANQLRQTLPSRVFSLATVLTRPEVFFAAQGPGQRRANARFLSGAAQLDHARFGPSQIKQLMIGAAELCQRDTAIDTENTIKAIVELVQAYLQRNLASDQLKADRVGRAVSDVNRVIDQTIHATYQNPFLAAILAMSLIELQRVVDGDMRPRLRGLVDRGVAGVYEGVFGHFYSKILRARPFENRMQRMLELGDWLPNTLSSEGMYSRSQALAVHIWIHGLMRTVHPSFRSYADARDSESFAIWLTNWVFSETRPAQRFFVRLFRVDFRIGPALGVGLGEYYSTIHRAMMAGLPPASMIRLQAEAARSAQPKKNSLPVIEVYFQTIVKELSLQSSDDLSEKELDLLAASARDISDEVDPIKREKLWQQILTKMKIEAAFLNASRQLPMLRAVLLSEWAIVATGLGKENKAQIDQVNRFLGHLLESASEEDLSELVSMWSAIKLAYIGMANVTWSARDQGRVTEEDANAIVYCVEQKAEKIGKLARALRARIERSRTNETSATPA